jgi:hypothetical protein
MFRAISESPLLHPLLFWVAGAALLLAVASRLPFLYAYLVAFGLEILADATLTSPWSPVPPNGHLATAVAVGFVILGDFRYFVALVRAHAREGMTRRGWLVAVGLSLVVPAVSQIPPLVFPAAFTDLRVTFLTYELLFFALALAVRLRLPALAGSAPYAAWAARATDFELCQYGLWATADVVILSGYDAGFLVRVVPNLMYYVLYLPFVAWHAPRALAEPWREARA